jgi:hypothetical protein
MYKNLFTMPVLEYLYISWLVIKALINVTSFMKASQKRFPVLFIKKCTPPIYISGEVIFLFILL